MSQITCKNQGFTLAEVLITLGIIGVVAAVSLPTLITNLTERRNSERHANIAMKITQAMEHMRATGKLVQYDSTESFVNELKNHIKISKICDKDHLTECWPTEKVIDAGGKEYDLVNAKTGKALELNTTTNNVGLILADGASIILNYDNKNEGLDVGDIVRGQNKDLPVGSGKTKNFPYTTNVTDAIDFVMDVNGKSKPNREKGTNGKQYDIRSFNNARFSYDIPWEDGDAGKILYLGNLNKMVDCRSSNSTSPDYEYCKPTPSGYSYDYWAGAKKACDEQTHGKGKLPTWTKTGELHIHKDKYSSLSSIPQDAMFWTSEETTNVRSLYVGVRNIYNNGGNNAFKFSANTYVVCVSN